VVWDNTTDADTASAARMRINLKPGQIVHIDTTENKSLNLQCGDNAETLAIVDNDDLVAFGTRQAEQPTNADGSKVIML
jgi:alpha-D-ribose 1-methylphosphonate 5-triphosphate synthase subunit PhnH